MQIRIYYEDTDLGGVVYHSKYLNFCERARSDVFFDKGIGPVLPSGHFVARKIVADYMASARLGDVLNVQTKLLKMKAASFVLSQIITKKSKVLFSEGKTVCLD